ncbi:MAG: hypothetical protein JRF72_09695 [Deltaproteobacteria bacterium]|jgi:hypothetical protein|nr:hypothetical protein [Deltaproteobacteria bacterium]
MRPPRFLAVPFELGRPFGAPNQPEFQTKVLRAALQLLERQDAPPILETFLEDAPEVEEETETAWSCPVSFAPKQDGGSKRLNTVLSEIEQLKPWVDIYTQKQGRPAHFVSGLELDQIVRFFDELADENPSPQTGSETPLPELIRLSIDDLRTWYSQAAQGQPGKKSFQKINEWFWTETAAAYLIADAAVALENHDDPFVRAVVERAMVQRQYKDHLFAALKKAKEGK